MPELPDVEVDRRRFAQSSLHKPVAHVHVRDDALLDEASPPLLSRRLKGETFEDTRRHGKHLAARTGGHGRLVLHFGMTGDLDALEQDEPEPDHTALLVDFEDGFHLAFTNARRLGKVRFVDDFGRFVDSEDLAPDALDISLSDFRALVACRSGAVKSLLMNQSALAGVGNVYADETLLHAGVRPDRATGDLSDDEVKAVHQELRHVLRTAIDRRAEPDDMPSSWLLPRRGEEASCPRCAGAIVNPTVNGRSTSWRPESQS